jgi:hypothetical protein
MRRVPALSLLALAACAGGLSAARAQQAPPRAGEPAVQRSVVEDDQARIEELRVRGRVQQVTVTPKNSRAPAYQILPTDPSADASRPDRPSAAFGQRVWQVLTF